MDEIDEREFTAHHYDGEAFAYEVERLEKHSPVEYAVTCRYLERWIEPGSMVVDVGVGVGHYDEFLARRGCRLFLVDISERLLQAAVERLSNAGLSESLLGWRQASAEDLGFIDTARADAVLMLGPLYHLRRAEQRRQAVDEATRILNFGGVLYAAGINRMAYLRDLYLQDPEAAVELADFHGDYLRHGNVDPDVAPPLGFAHLTTVAEMRLLFVDLYEELAVAGVESFLGHVQTRIHELSDEARRAWIELVWRTGRTVEGHGAAEHLLFVGRRHGLFDNG